MHKYKLLISYDGTAYSGWQVQPNALSIQEKIENALEQLLKQKTRVCGASRTDAGVHARGQVAHFNSGKPLELKLLLKALNGILPRDIRILALEEVSPSFHAQFSAKKKVYHYHVWTEKPTCPFLRLYRTYFPFSLNLDEIKKATTAFLGERDFATFANVGSKPKNTIRTLYRLDLVEQEGGFRLEFEGNGFLYKMVRNITGTLLDIGLGKLLIDDIEGLFLAKDRRSCKIAAPPQGLCLISIDY